MTHAQPTKIASNALHCSKGTQMHGAFTTVSLENDIRLRKHQCGTFC